MGLTNAQYDRIIRMYDQRQYRRQDLARERYDELCRTIPGYKDIHGDLARLGVQAAKAVLADDSDLADKYRKEMDHLRKKRRQLLAQSGYSEDYEQPPCECADCQDTGFVDGKKCHCFRKAAVELLYEEARLTPAMEQAEFNGFSLDYYSRTHRDERGHSPADYAARAKKLCMEFASSFGAPEQAAGLFLYGDVGVGKTFLTACIAKELIRREFFVLYFSAVRFFDTMADGTFRKDRGDADRLYDSILQCDLLIIDDLGTELSNQFTATQLFSCINERLLADRPVIISTNLSLDAIKDLYTERIFSRITSRYTLIPMQGEDIRLKKRFERR